MMRGELLVAVVDGQGGGMGRGLVEVGGQEGLLGQVLGRGSVPHQLEADRVDQPLILDHQLGKGRVCQFVHAVPPPPFVVRHLSYGTAGRISSTSLKIF